MAYSHSESTYEGSQGGNYHVHAATDIVAQEEENNRTLVRFYGYMQRHGGVSVWNLAATYCNIQPDGVLVNGNVNGYDGRTSWGPWYGITYDMWIGHNADGTRGVQAYFYHNAGNMPYLGQGWTVHTCWLPAYYRYADPTYVEANTVTDVGFRFRVDSNRLSDLLAISLDGGAWQYFYGDWWSRTEQLGGSNAPLISGHTYSVRISIRRKNSGYWKEAGNWNVTTASQNGFFDLGDF